MSPTLAFVYPRVIPFCFRSLAYYLRSLCRAFMSSSSGLCPSYLSSFRASVRTAQGSREISSKLLSILVLGLSAGCLGALAPLQSEVHSSPSPPQNSWPGRIRESPTPQLQVYTLIQFLSRREGGTQLGSRVNPARCPAMGKDSSPSRRPGERQHLLYLFQLSFSSFCAGIF